MKKWAAAFLLLPFFCAAQGVRLNQYDKFIKKHRVELEPVALLSSSSATLAVAFTSVAQDLFVQVSGSGWGATTINDGNELLFQFANDSAVAVSAAGLQTFQMDLEKNTYRHRYRISRRAVEALAQHGVTGIRKFSFNESSDIKLSREQRARLQKPAALFLSELEKAAGAKPLFRINAAAVAAHVGDSVRFCSHVYNVRYIETETKAVVLELQSDFSHPIVHVVIAEEDRDRFGPETSYLNGAVCVSGVVALHNGMPTIVARTGAQLQPANGTTDPAPSTTTTQTTSKQEREQ